ncbi:MAG: DnaJ family molecular chaperone [Pseudomonadota bacterium]
MSIWSQISEFLTDVANDAFSGVVEAVRTVFEGDPETRRQVGFSVAMIALSAKMAKADGVVTQDEVKAFQQIFDIPQKEFNNVSKLYNLAKQDVAGFHSYASKIKRLFSREPEILEDVMDGLFHIAKADGLYHENEMSFMDDIADIFEITGRDYERIRLRHMEPEDGNPYVLLEADPQWGDVALKKHYHKLIAENHPDKMIARGVPEEFLAIANERVAKINKAWDRIKLERRL